VPIRSIAPALCLGLALSLAAGTAFGGEPGTANPLESAMSARGTFDVTMIPQAPDTSAAGPFSRLVMDKRYHGDLEATGQGQMLAFQSAVEGSAGYVAMESVSGSLAGRAGTFALQHVGAMKQGAIAVFTVTIVPDSGTGDLTGIAGELVITFEGSRHLYELRYTLPGE